MVAMPDDGDVAPDEAPLAPRNVVHSETTTAVQAHTVSGGVHIHPTTAPSAIPRLVLALGAVAVLAVGAIAVRQWVPPEPANSASGQADQGGGTPFPNPTIQHTPGAGEAPAATGIWIPIVCALHVRPPSVERSTSEPLIRQRMFGSGETTSVGATADRN